MKKCLCLVAVLSFSSFGVNGVGASAVRLWISTKSTKDSVKKAENDDSQQWWFKQQQWIKQQEYEDSIKVNYVPLDLNELQRKIDQLEPLVDDPQ